MSEQRTYRAPSLVLESVSVTYGEQVAISDASLQVEPGELMALVGPSGCGKSSLLGAINRMSDGVSGCRVGGRIWLDGEDVRQRHDLTVLRRQVGMVFQQPNPFRYPSSTTCCFRWPSTAFPGGIDVPVPNRRCAMWGCGRR